jgi:hypothetical protein
LVEEALRLTVNTVVNNQPSTTPPEAGQGLEDNDPFFAALDEIRSAGRQPAPHREARLG